MELNITTSQGKTYSCFILLNKKSKQPKLRITQFGELQLTLPYKFKLSPAELEKLILQKEVWILEHLPEKPLFPTLLELPAINEIWTLEYKTSGSLIPKLIIQSKTNTLEIHGTNHPQEYQILLQKFLLKKAKKFFPAFINQCINTYSFSTSPKKLRIGLQKSRWGSYSSSQTLSLNARLLCLPLHLVIFVIVHELCHSVHLNHQSEFHKLLYDKMPDYRLKEKEMKLAGKKIWI